MSVSRWKIMAGMFGLSVAGIYAVAGPTTNGKTDTKSMPTKSGVVVLSEPPLASPVMPTSPVVPASGVIPVTATADLVIPAVPTQLPVPLTLPADLPTPPPLIMSLPQLPKMEEMPVVEPVGGTMPSSVTLPRETVEAAPVPIVLEVPATPAIEIVPAPVPPMSPPEPPPAKFRTVLRVGDGDPVFEVRSGDNIVLKVVSEKVDVKSAPEVGQSVSSVRAIGKVKFVGFGSEGSCDELSFLAGTGEVTLSGNVRVQVKDKIGRLESELTGEKMNYRLDAGNTTLAGGLEP